MGVDQGTEGLPVRPGGGHVVDVDPGVGVEEEPTPLLQGLTSRQSHPPTSRLSSVFSLSPLSHHLLAIKTALNTLLLLTTSLSLETSGNQTIKIFSI